ncbi:synaptonemal complex protein 3-like isoform X2 [Trichomycterus rosablanca]|uniref:synaptonemal complex protein 3-like isoform X2 n=1 Tax=Trichomycterus rosablanca TaxID=2290929 RepID=UPI002F35C359
MSTEHCSTTMDTNKTGAAVKGQKRRSSTDRSINTPQGGGMKTMLDSFRADINKSFVAKRKCLESLTSSALKTSQQKIEELWRCHQKERAQICEDYSSQFSSEFQQWDTDIQKSKDQDKKLMSLFQHLQMMFQQMRASQNQRLKTLKQLVDHYAKSSQELQEAHEDQNTAALNDLRQEIALLQKKILMSAQEEMASVRKALHSMLM